MDCRRIIFRCLPLLAVVVPVLAGAGEQKSAPLAPAHQAILADPADLDAAYAYAQQAIEEGNYEAAVSVLEGMLVINRRQPRLLFELGVLYQRLGAPRTARLYLEQASQYTGEDSTLSRLSQSFLADTDRALSESGWSGNVIFGLQYQANPSLGPGAGQIFINGALAPRPSGIDDDSDTGLVVLGQAEHRYQPDYGMRWLSRFTGYGLVYADHSDLDYGALEASSGPLFQTNSESLGRLGVRPHLVLRGTLSDGHVFERTAGLGIDLISRSRSNSYFEGTYQYRDSDFEAIESSGDDADRSGDEHRLSLLYQREVARDHLVSVRAYGQFRDASEDFYSRELYGVALRYSRRLPNALWPEQRDMTLTPFVILQRADYDDPNPSVDPATTRRDDETRLGVSALAPFAPGWSLFANLEYTDVDSNIVNYDAEDTALMLGVQKNF